MFLFHLQFAVQRWDNLRICVPSSTGNLVNNLALLVVSGWQMSLNENPSHSQICSLCQQEIHWFYLAASTLMTYCVVFAMRMDQSRLPKKVEVWKRIHVFGMQVEGEGGLWCGWELAACRSSAIPFSLIDYLFEGSISRRLVSLCRVYGPQSQHSGGVWPEPLMCPLWCPWRRWGRQGCGLRACNEGRPQWGAVHCKGHIRGCHGWGEVWYHTWREALRGTSTGDLMDTSRYCW